MSRIGRSPIPCPPGSPLAVDEEHRVTVKGPRASWPVRCAAISIRQDGDVLVVERPDDQRQNRALHGLTRSLVATWSPASPRASPRSSRSSASATAPCRRARVRSSWRSASRTPSTSPPRRRDLRGASATRITSRESTRKRSVRSQLTSASSASPSPTRARASATRASGSSQGREGSQVMARTDHKQELRRRRHKRVRRRVEGSAGRPRLAVFRSNKHISAQLIDDLSGRTLAAASTVEPSLRAAPAATSRRPRPWAPSWPRGPRTPASPPWSSTRRVRLPRAGGRVGRRRPRRGTGVLRWP